MEKEIGESPSMLNVKKWVGEKKKYSHDDETKKEVKEEAEEKLWARLGRTATGKRMALVSASPQIILQHFYQFPSRTIVVLAATYGRGFLMREQVES